jgi:hypothetical protein
MKFILILLLIIAFGIVLGTLLFLFVMYALHKTKDEHEKTGIW